MGPQMIYKKATNMSENGASKKLLSKYFIVLRS